MNSINFHLPGIYRNFPLNWIVAKLLEEHPEYFRAGIRIAGFYGEFPVSMWNGGRESYPSIQCTKEVVSNIVKITNELGIGIEYTYSNLELTSEDLNDEFCNYCMSVANNGMNSVILTSDLLEDYIRTNYTKFSIISSTCKCLSGVQQLNTEINKGYDLVVVNYNLNNRFDLLEAIDNKKKCEVLLNETCMPNCPYMKEHYKRISQNQKILHSNMKIVANKQIKVNYWECKMPHTDTSRMITPEDLYSKYVDMGFTDFKIRGRRGALFEIIEDYIYYMIKPEYKDHFRTMVFSNLVENGVITINM